MDYEEKVREATTAQGLDPLIEALRAKRAIHLEQTGGFCMAVTVPYTAGTWAITKDTNWIVVWYAGDGWKNGDEETESFFLENLDDVVAKVLAPLE